MSFSIKLIEKKIKLINDRGKVGLILDIEYSKHSKKSPLLRGAKAVFPHHLYPQKSL